MNTQARIKPNGAAIEELAARGGITAEHVVLSSGLGDDNLPVQRSTVVRQRVVLSNPVLRTRVELRIFKDNKMSVIEQRNNARPSERVIDLRFIDPSPKLSRYIAKKTLRLALTLFTIGAVSLLLALNSILMLVSVPVTLAAMAGGFVTIARYIHRTRETIEFRTKNGCAVVIALVANIGCQRAYRASVPELVAAIRFANGKALQDQSVWLREEVREHYRLASIGVIGEAACEQATRRILSKF